MRLIIILLVFILILAYPISFTFKHIIAAAGSRGP